MCHYSHRIFNNATRQSDTKRVKEIPSSCLRRGRRISPDGNTKRGKRIRVSSARCRPSEISYVSSDDCFAAFCKMNCRCSGGGKGMSASIRRLTLPVSSSNYALGISALSRHYPKQKQYDNTISKRGNQYNYFIHFCSLQK